MGTQEQWFMAKVGWNCSIVAVDVVKRTPKMITYLKDNHVRCKAIKSSHVAFFAAWDTAHAWLLSMIEDELQTTQRRWQRAQANYEAIKKMAP